jgi:thiol:disulfide interchange protein
MTSALLTFGTVVSQAEVTFSKASFSEALKLAKEQKKAIMIDYYTDWCGWCKVLDKKTYTDSEVGKYADENFISLKIDAERGEGVELSKRSKIQGFPTIIFYNESGEEIHRVVGYQDAKRFLESMKVAISNHTAIKKKKAAN